MKKRIIGLLLAAAVISTALVGCGSSDSGSSTGGSGSTDSKDTGDTAASGKVTITNVS